MAETMKRQGTSLLAVMTKRSLISLPEEIMYDIFSRLQIKDLFRFRSVCKDWNKFITDPYFVDLHHTRINQDQHGSNFLIKCCSTGTSDKPFSKLYLIDDGNHDSISLKAYTINFNLPSTQIKLVGSSNGLLCLCSIPDYETYYICNPLTREVLPLPRACGLDTYREKGHLCSPSPSGFAFDTTTNTYKVIRTWCFADDIYDYRLLKTGVEIYTLGSERWRRVEDVPTCFFNLPETSQVLVNGALHWHICCQPESEFYNSIGAIDVRSENFRAFKMPPNLICTRQRTLGVLRESLCVIADTCMGFDNVVILWIMKDYGIRESWTADYIVKSDRLGPLQRVPFKIFKTWKQQSLSLYGNKDQGYYDLEENKFEHVMIEGLPRSLDQVEAAVHLGSLISPKRIDFPSAEMTCSKTPARTRPKRKLTCAQTSKTERTRPKQKFKKSLRS